MKKYQLLLTMFALSAPSLSLGTAGAVTPTGLLTCMDNTSSSNLIYVEFSGTGTTGANLYRYGAAHAIATYPNRDSGKGTYNDTGLGAGNAYHYELHSGTQVLATKDCRTKSTPPAAAPAASPSAAPNSPPPPPAVAPAVNQTPAANPTSAANSGSASSNTNTTSTNTNHRTTSPVPVIEQAPVTSAATDAAAVSQTDTPAPSQPDPSVIASGEIVPPQPAAAAKKTNSWLSFLWIPAAFFIALIIFVLIRRHTRQRVPNVVEPLLSEVSDQPLEMAAVTPPPIPPPMFYPTMSGDTISQGITDAFYPSAPSPVQKAKPDEPEDMYEIAQKYPESYGNVHYTDSLASSPTSKPILEPGIPLRMSSPLQASQLHQQVEPTNPYSDRSILS